MSLRGCLDVAATQAQLTPRKTSSSATAGEAYTVTAGSTSCGGFLIRMRLYVHNHACLGLHLASRIHHDFRTTLVVELYVFYAALHQARMSISCRRCTASHHACFHTVPKLLSACRYPSSPREQQIADDAHHLNMPAITLC